MVHAFLVIEKDGKYIYFEPLVLNKGIYYFDEKEKLLQFTLKSFAQSLHIKNVSKIKQIEYPPLTPKTTFEEITKIFLSTSKFKQNKRKI